MIDGPGLPLGPTSLPPRPPAPPASSPAPAATPPPPGQAAPPARGTAAVPPAGAPALGRDAATFSGVRTTGFDLGPLPFEAPPPRGEFLTARDWTDVSLATRQAGLGGLLDRLSGEVATGDPVAAAQLPVLVDSPSGYRAQPRRVLDAARRMAGNGWGESAGAVAALAVEAADPQDKPLHVAAAMLADRLGDRAAASHALFRLAERAGTPADALAAARRAGAMGYPENAKYGYYRAAQLSPDAAGALAAAREAHARGLRFEADEPAGQRWRAEMDAAFRGWEGPPTGPRFASASPYAEGALPRPAFVSPYLPALRKARPDDLGAIARLATLAGESATARLAWRRVRELAT